jgi:hypothetical protein
MQFFGGPHDGREVDDQKVEGLSEIHFRVGAAEPGGEVWHHVYILSREDKRYVYKGQVKTP